MLHRNQFFLINFSLFALFFLIASGGFLSAEKNDFQNDYLQPVYTSSVNKANKASFVLKPSVDSDLKFKISPLFDGILLGTGAAVYASYFLCDKILGLNEHEFSGDVLNRESVNPFDRLVMNPYSKPLDIAGTLVGAVAVASPAVFAFLPKEYWFETGLMYAETLLFAYSLKCMGKFLFSRPRPYMYFQNFPVSDVQSGDWDDSFPSAHSTFTFASAAFTTYVFNAFFPDSPWRFAVAGGVYAVALTTAALRVSSGNHFMTDVLAGAAIGSLCGFAIPILHQTGLTSFSAKVDLKTVQSVGVSLMPAGILFSVDFM